MKLTHVLLLCFTLLSCTKDPDDSNEFMADYDMNGLIQSVRYKDAPDFSPTISIDEASGMIPCSYWDKGYWLINDSGDGPHLYLVNSTTGKVIKTLSLMGCQNVDWEDLACYVSSNADMRLLVADIGDNNANRLNVKVYSFDEPHFSDFDTINSQWESFQPQELKTWTISYPDGPRDAEAFFVDPFSGQPFIVTKRTARAMVYSIPANPSVGGDTAYYLGSIPTQFITGADCALDDQGVRRILLRNYGQLFEWVWPSASGIDEAFMHPPTILPYDPIEPQGESICYTLNNGFSVMSEKVDTVFPVIYHYSLK
jgi:hypothetical protein